MKELFNDIIASNESNPYGWTTVTQACALATSIVALRPEVSVEIGVFGGKGLIPMGMAHRSVGCGLAIGIDPWSAQCSIEGQVHNTDVEWWGSVDHEKVYEICLDEIKKYKLQDWVKIIRAESDATDPPENIGVLRIDGNHGDPAYRDASRFCPNVVPGGIVFLDDVGWSGGSVAKAKSWMINNGYRLLYPLEDGEVFQKA